MQAGDKIVLNNVSVYKNSVRQEPQTQISGDFYVMNGVVINNRVKIIEELGNTEPLGWIDLADLQEEEIPEAITIEEMIAEPAFEKYEVKTSDSKRLNVRKTPGLEAAIVTVVPPQTTLTVCDEAEGWGRIEEFPGWICLKFVTKA